MFSVDQENNYINLDREVDAIKTKDGNVCDISKRVFAFIYG